MKLECEMADSVVVAKTTGRITASDFDSSQDPLAAALGPDGYSRKILLDLSGSDFIDSSGISWLLQSHKKIREAGGRFVLYSVTPLVMQVLRMMRMDQVFNLADDLAGARGMI